MMRDQAQELRELAARVGTNKSPEMPARAGRVLTVTSGKGGVGKTNLTVNLGLALQRRGHRVLLFDADLGLANVGVILGAVPGPNLSQVLRGEKELAEIVSSHRGLQLVSGGSGVQELLDMEEWQLQRFLRGLEELEIHNDFMIIDTAAGISRQVLAFVLSAEDIIVVTTPEPTAITDAYALIKVIASHNHQAVVRLLVNRAANPQVAGQVVRKLQLVSREFLGLELHNLGYVLEDNAITRAVMAQEPFYLAHPQAAASKCVDYVADQFSTGRAGTGSRPETGLFQRMLSLFR